MSWRSPANAPVRCVTTTRIASSVVLVELLGLEPPVLALDEDLDAAARLVEEPLALEREAHPLLEERDRLLERQLASLQPLDDRAQLAERFLERLGHTRSLRFR